MSFGSNAVGETVFGYTEDTISITTVTSSTILKWNIYENIYRNFRVNWEIQNGIASNYTFNWDILNTINNNLIVNWSIPATVSIRVNTYYTVPVTNRTFVYTG